MEWFPPGAERTAGNQVQAYIDCADYYAAVAAEIGAARAGSTVLVAGWSFDPGTPVGGGKIGDVLARAAGSGVRVRVLLSGHLTHGNDTAAGWLNARRGIVACIDERLPAAGSCHQKIVAVDGEVAFLGGMDFGTDRLGDPAHGPWHDVQVRLKGPAAFDVYERLARRWNTHHIGGRQPLPPRLRPGPRRAPGATVHIAATATSNAVSTAVARELSAVAAATLPVLTPVGSIGFVPVGDRSLHDMLLHAIRTAATTIYVEDQFFVGVPDVVQALADTVAKPDFKQLIVLTARAEHAQADLRQTNRHRRDVLRRLTAAFPAKVSVWTYKADRDQHRCGWLHAKTWIFDDTMAVVGSANFNRRGLTHDREIAAGIVDPAGVGELRRRLWRKHLSGQDVADFAAAAGAPGSVLERLDVQADERAHPDRLILCGRPTASSLAPLLQHLMCGILPLLGIRANTFEEQWDLIIDPDGS